MSVKLSDRVQRVKPSPTLAVTAKAAELRAAGKDIIGLGAGEPDFDTPEHIKAAAVEAISNGFTKYTAVDGTPSLKKAIVDKFARDNSFDYTPEQVLVSCGGKQSYFNLCQALLNSGDEVIIPAPYWVSYPDMALLADGKPVIVSAGQDQNFKITPEQLEAAITPRTKLFTLNSPSNPTGVAYTRAELEALGKVLEGHPEIIIAVDDMYEHILWSDEPFCNLLNACPALYDRTVVMNGVSKAYSMTGWRIGYAAGPVDLIKAMKKVQSQSTSNPTSISQVAAQAAIEGDQGCIAPMLEAFKARHDYVVERLNQMKGVECVKSDGTFYAFPSFQEVIDGLDDIDDDVALAEILLNEAGVALVPGSAFGAPGHLRLSFATSKENLQQALDRIASYLDGINS
ncbi:aspartate aminotransferase [Solemya pervernicosa gill symbiont]|uniref:Aminotransferase n=2 Tax=Gammaproteobacteria incertae sedis TaxID=118884 RepID=A0A1T2L9B5_9GAMM|nr:pyridoxal phosphate-dependent aminotransferase [Candidatus Reidiella endopervernicosa]OOZ41687.1 aspartate aminotransferase [Solemya pervernicosa gill symbiont]QKQ26663.1 pyridoxal phosphate-dependent aminotransferase [Candidatus Reidiella endopervernicosa]